MLRIELTSKVEETKGKRKDGGEYSVTHQHGFMVTDQEKRRVKIRLRGAPFSPGLYVVADSTFSTDQYDNFVVGQVELEPLKK